MSDYPQDDLNAFFKSKLENAKPDENMWNVPPDFVFDNAVSKINSQEPKRKPAYWRWALLLLLLIGLLSSVFMLVKSNNNYKAANARLQSALSTKDQKIISLENELFEKTSAITAAETKIEFSNQTIEKLQDEVDAKRNVALKNNQQQIQRKANQTSIESKFNKRNNQSIVANNNEIISISTSKDDIAQNDLINNNRSPEIASIPKILSKTNFILANEREVNLNGLDFITLSNSKNDLVDEVFKYGFFLNQNYSSLAMENIPSQSVSNLTKYDNHYSGLGFKFQAEKTVSSKVDMRFALAYQNIQNRSHLDKSNLYDPQNEIDMGNGQMAYNLDVIIDTPFGEVGTQTNFAVDPTLVAPNDEIRQETNTTQSLNIVSLTVGPKYNFIKSDKWAFFAAANLGFNRILHYNNQMQTSLVLHDLKMADFESKPPLIKDINKNYLSAAIGLGFGLYLTDNLQFVFDGQYGQSLNSLRVPKNSSGPLTYLKQWQTQVGLNYIF
ncbi:MAG: hypothetical protein HKO66_08705 [Saprospiraceae bacterium]|nr:hypothetical protein [Saprospiraceae bacterium]